MKRYIGDGEAAPVHVHGLWRPAFKVGTVQSEEVLAILTDAVGSQQSIFFTLCESDLRDAFVRHGAVVQIIDRTLQFLQAERQACASRQQCMSQIFNLILLRPLLARSATVFAEVCAFREDEQPHWIKTIGAR